MKWIALTILPVKFAGYGVVAGFLMLAAGYDRQHIVEKVLRKGLKTKGRVVELRDDPGGLFGGPRRAGFAPVVEYESVSGNIHKHYSMTFRSPARYEIGQEVDIWYKHYRSRRDAALSDDQVGTWPMQLMKIGGVLLVISVILLLPRVMEMIDTH